MIRDALVPVYAALDLEWDPETTGAVEDEVAGVGLDETEAAILAELDQHFELIEDETRRGHARARGRARGRARCSRLRLSS